MVNGNIQKIPKGSILFVRPDDYHDILNPNLEKIFIVFISITKDLLYKTLKFLSDDFNVKPLTEPEMPPFVVLNEEDISFLSSKFNKLNTIDIKNSNIKLVTFHALLADIFSLYFANIANSSQDEIPSWLLNARSQMESIEHFSQGAEHMAELCNYSKEHLSRVMQKYYNETTIDFINNIRISYIANQLVNSNLSLLELCFKCGYNNLSWMYTLFKRKYGMSPAKFRKHYSKDKAISTHIKL